MASGGCSQCSGLPAGARGVLAMLLELGRGSGLCLRLPRSLRAECCAMFLPWYLSFCGCVTCSCGLSWASWRARLVVGGHLGRELR